MIDPLFTQTHARAWDMGITRPPDAAVVLQAGTLPALAPDAAEFVAGTYTLVGQMCPCIDEAAVTSWAMSTRTAASARLSPGSPDLGPA